MSAGDYYPKYREMPLSRHTQWRWNGGNWGIVDGKVVEFSQRTPEPIFMFEEIEEPTPVRKIRKMSNNLEEV